MCVIAAKPAGIELPSEIEIENMWNRNPDGAGLMFADGKDVRIEKGFMTLERFKKRLAELDSDFDLKNRSVVMHFRITTHGGTSPENTHPFPISDSVGMLRKLKLKVPLGVAHNGIIRVTPRKDISDTMEYIAGQLAPLSKSVPKFYKDKNLLQMIEHATDSKLAFLDAKGAITTVGRFEEHNGIMYSNNSYEKSQSWRDYYWDEWEDEYNGWENHKVSSYRTRKVMWLDDSKGEYVMNILDGEYEDGEFAIDASGLLYIYNWKADYLTEVKSGIYQALTAQGLPLRYNPKSEMITTELVLET